LSASPGHAPGITTRQVVYGLGGVGKTRFAVEYALRHSKEYQALLFVSADKREALDRNLATLCGPLILDLPEQDTKEEAARYHAVLRWLQAQQGWLLVLDNVDTPEAAQAVEALVGSLQGGTVLITSRLADWSSEIPTLELDELAESAAVEFLLERTEDRRRRLPTDEKDAQALAHVLDRLALALEQAGAFIAQKRSSLADYLARWRQRDEAVRKWNDERLAKFPRELVTTWDTTVEQLSPEGLALLRQLSWLGV
jgi:septal ring factor EnvC (AmiA/AmiB activator)